MYQFEIADAAGNTVVVTVTVVVAMGACPACRADGLLDEVIIGNDRPRLRCSSCVGKLRDENSVTKVIEG